MLPSIAPPIVYGSSYRGHLDFSRSHAIACWTWRRRRRANLEKRRRGANRAAGTSAISVLGLPCPVLVDFFSAAVKGERQAALIVFLRTAFDYGLLSCGGAERRSVGRLGETVMRQVTRKTEAPVLPYDV